ncbi:MAG: SRPBCC family protein [Flavobacteriales bacterium]
MSNKVQVAPHGERAILITRSFKAPRALVFDAMSKPEMMKHWFHGPAGWTLTTCDMDLRAGGSYRWVWTNDKGHEMGMGGKIIEVAPPGRMVTTEKFDDAWYEGEALNTLVLTEEKGVTLMSLIVEYGSTAARDGVLSGPMASGMEASYARLDTYLASRN